MRKKLTAILALCLIALTAVFAGMFGCKQPEPAPDDPTPAPEVTYTITFLAADDTELSVIIVKEGETPAFSGTYPTLPEETAEKTFAWEWDKAFVAAKSDATYKLVLKETIKEYTVKFYAEDGTSVLSTATYKYGTQATAPAAPEKTDYAFEAWYTAKEGGEKVTDFTVKGNAEYYARYVETAKEYTVKFYAEDGTTVLSTATYKYGAAITAPAAPEKPATEAATYEFDGWYTAKEGGEKVTDFTVKGNAEYYARYTKNAVTFEVIFYDDDGAELKKYRVAYGEIAVGPEVTGKDGDEQYSYVFEAWYDETEEYDGKIVTDFTVKANSYYYARYKAVLNKYSVTFVSDGVVISEEEVEYGYYPTVPADPEKEGLLFAGWDNEVEKVTGDVIYTAVFGRGLSQADVANFKQILNENPAGVFVLTEDLDFGNAQTAEVINFGGILNGNGYSLKNLLVHFDARDDGWESYLFAENTGTIRNLGVYYTLKANGSKGSLIYQNSGTVSNVFVKVSATGKDEWTLGAVVNTNDGGTVENCITVINEDSTGTANFGSIVGVDKLGTIKNCYSVTNGKITSDKPNAAENGKGIYENNANYTTMAELAAAITFNSENGWNTEYTDRLFAEVVAIQNAGNEISSLAVLSRGAASCEDDRVADFAAEDLKYYFKLITGKTLNVKTISSLSELDAGVKYFVLGKELAEEAALSFEGLTTETGYIVQKTENGIYLYGNTAYGTLNAVYAMLNQAFGLEIYTDEVYTADRDSFEYSRVADRAVFNP